MLVGRRHGGGRDGHADALGDQYGFLETPFQVAIGFALLAVVIEAARRAIGWPLPTVAALALLYAFFGHLIPGEFGHSPLPLRSFLGTMTIAEGGIWGSLTAVSVGVVSIFVIFGAVLNAGEAGQGFMNVAAAAAGRLRGGAAKVSVLSSALFGSISGSASANVASTGAITLPAMTRLGYPRRLAAGVEAVASSGGQIMPPLMGAGAFLMSEFTQVPYIHIVLVSIFPAFLYFGSVYLLVHIAALKLGLEGMPASELPRVRAVLAEGWHFLLPLVALMYFLIAGYSPMRVGFFAVVSIAIAAVGRALWSFFRDAPTLAGLWALTRHGARLTLRALELGARNAVAVSMACAVAGIIVGIVGLTGLGLKFSAMMLAFSGGNMVLALLLVILASLILGMGLPVTAAYIVLIILVGPALTNEFGVPLLIAHLVVFWYSQDSNVTPPVALAGFAASAIAGSKPMETSFQAWKYAKGLYLIPLFMVFNDAIILGGPLPLVLWNGAIAIVALVGFAALLEGHLFAPVPPLQRALLLPAIVAVFWPSITVEAIGAAVLVALMGLNRRAATNRTLKPGAPRDSAG